MGVVQDPEFQQFCSDLLSGHSYGTQAILEIWLKSVQYIKRTHADKMSTDHIFEYISYLFGHNHFKGSFNWLHLSVRYDSAMVAYESLNAMQKIMCSVFGSQVEGGKAQMLQATSKDVLDNNQLPHVYDPSQTSVMFLSIVPEDQNAQQAQQQNELNGLIQYTLNDDQLISENISYHEDPELITNSLPIKRSSLI